MAALFPERGLSAAHIVGAAVVAAIGQLVVDMPEGYFGASENLTSVGAIFAASTLLLSLLSVLFLVRGSRWARRAFTLLIAGNIGAYVPVLATDPIMAGGVIAWQLSILGREFFALRPLGDTAFARRRATEEPRLARWLPFLTHSLLVSLAVTTTVVGFEANKLPVAEISCLVIDVLVLGLTAPVLVPALRTSRAALAGTLITIITIALSHRDLSVVIGVLGVYQLCVLVWLTMRGPFLGELVEHFLERPALLLLTSFGMLIVLGAVVLSFPASAAEATRIDPLDALFTATSAVCVTGLIVLDTPTAFSGFGHAVILFLIQVGGLGIMVLSTFAAVILGGRLGLRGEAALEEVLELTSPARAYELTRFIVLSTLGIELFGGAVLAWCFQRQGLPFDEAVWRGMFHSVSAFCNAGFALQTDSVVIFQEDPLALLTLTVLITAGGLGFVVLGWCWRRFVRRKQERASEHVKIVMVVSAALLFGGAVLFALLEWNNLLGGLGTGHKLHNALFQSALCRTAGFNSLDFTGIKAETTVVLMVLMFIGGSPGGTGGGIKTTTLAILVATIPAMARGGIAPVLFRREVGPATVMRAATISFIALLLSVIIFVLLLATHHDVGFLSLAFETASALATVGLSIGATGQLNEFGKIVIILAMFLGRLGPLTLALLLGTPRRRAIAYPEAKIMVG